MRRDGMQSKEVSGVHLSEEKVEGDGVLVDIAQGGNCWQKSNKTICHQSFWNTRSEKETAKEKEI